MIQSRSGRMVDNDEFGGTENEVIFLPGSKFLVTGVEQTAQGITVEMTEEAQLN